MWQKDNLQGGEMSMKPDFELDQVRLFNCDCMDFMAEIPDKTLRVSHNRHPVWYWCWEYGNG